MSAVVFQIKDSLCIPTPSKKSNRPGAKYLQLLCLLIFTMVFNLEGSHLVIEALVALFGKGSPSCSPLIDAQKRSGGRSEHSRSCEPIREKFDLLMDENTYTSTIVSPGFGVSKCAFQPDVPSSADLLMHILEGHHGQDLCRKGRRAVQGATVTFVAKKDAES
ncbi:4053_t:CDS:2 [Ambispora gerdemannii]|uniref:4053_t:CDS:1 n=1 Tax=Ambispora gerdemannii TaxID=144530 RepID=A0A9N9F342_9GLOM|nr:4053_t:CDS:2 [Ambispora gerdemannii]